MKKERLLNDISGVVIIAFIVMFCFGICKTIANEKQKEPICEHTISFYADNCIDFIYSPNTKKYYIEYYDPDVFDNERYGDYVILECEKIVFFAVLDDIENQIDVEEKWGIVEINENSFKLKAIKQCNE